jgi:UPF0716 protein FxsA
MRLPLLILLLPVIELWLMIEIGGEVGALAVIGWLILMIVVGVNLLRYLGASSMLRTAQNMRMGGELPAQALADNLFKAVGAVLLIIPGFLTDLLALLCFIPLVRQLLLKRWLAKVAVRASTAGFYGAGFNPEHFKRGPFSAGQGNVYEHQGSAANDKESKNEGLLIDQLTDSTPSPSDQPPVDNPPKGPGFTRR